MIRKTTTLVFCLALVVGLFGVLLVPAAFAATVTEWCFQDAAGTTFTLTPNQGAGTAAPGSGITPAASPPTGNLSATCAAGLAWSATNWTTSASRDQNDYFEFSVDTTGLTGITVKFDNRASGTGPTFFDLYYSTDGVNFVSFATGQATAAAFTPNPMNTFDLSAITALNNNTNAKFRLYGYGGTSAAGTWRLDNFLVENSGTLAVTLASFTAQGGADRVTVAWETVSEMGNAGFNLYRSSDPAGPLTLLAYVPSQGPGSSQGFAYGYEDLAVQPGETWWYTLEDVALNGATTLHGPVSATVQAPTAVTLSSVTASPAAGTGVALPWLLGAAGAGLALAASRLRRRA